MTIGNGVTSVGDEAFNGCNGLTSVTIPDSVTSIGSSAFMNCSGLMSVTIGNGVTNIGEEAFNGCNNLSEMQMLGFTCDEVKTNALNWGIAVPAKQLVTI